MDISETIAASGPGKNNMSNPEEGDLIVEVKYWQTLKKSRHPTSLC